MIGHGGRSHSVGRGTDNDVDVGIFSRHSEKFHKTKLITVRIINVLIYYFTNKIDENKISLVASKSNFEDYKRRS
ncbi:hypothetical protein Hanom_Chr04g00336851 [Helianthus anomalus]